MSQFTEDDVIGIGWAAVQNAGHFHCGGWSMDSRDALLVCACGETLYRLEAVGQ